MPYAISCTHKEESQSGSRQEFQRTAIAAYSSYQSRGCATLTEWTGWARDGRVWHGRPQLGQPPSRPASQRWGWKASPRRPTAKEGRCFFSLRGQAARQYWWGSRQMERRSRPAMKIWRCSLLRGQEQPSARKSKWRRLVWIRAHRSPMSRKEGRSRVRSRKNSGSWGEKLSQGGG